MAIRREKPPQVKERGQEEVLFYYEDAVDAWVRVDGELERLLLDFLYWEGASDDQELKLRRKFMTADEIKALPED